MNIIKLWIHIAGRVDKSNAQWKVLLGYLKELWTASVKKERNSLSAGRISIAQVGHIEIIGSPSRSLHFILSDPKDQQEKSAFISQLSLWHFP